MKRELHVVIERDPEGWLVGSIPELRGCHTQARTLNTLMKRIREAALLCLEVEGEQSEHHEFVGVQTIQV